MSTKSRLTERELGTIEAVLIGFNKHQLPRLVAIKKKVDKGGVLDEFEITFLEETLAEIRAGEYFADHHDDYKTLMGEVAELYQHIAQRAKDNEGSSSEP